MAKLQLVLLSVGIALAATQIVRSPQNVRNQQQQQQQQQPLQQQEEEPDINTIPGEPGKDYPIYHSIPRTNFKCSGKIPGYYADVEARCQLWHYCNFEGLVESFLCPNGTIYSQERRVCEWWFSVDCSQTERNVDVNKDLYIIPEPTKSPQKSAAAAQVVPSAAAADQPSAIGGQRNNAAGRNPSRQ